MNTTQNMTSECIQYKCQKLLGFFLEIEAGGHTVVPDSSIKIKIDGKYQK